MIYIYLFIYIYIYIQIYIYIYIHIILHVWFVLNNSCAAAPTIHLTILTFSSPDVGSDSFHNVKCGRMNE